MVAQEDRPRAVAPVWNRREWYVACYTTELGPSPIQRTILGERMALFRGEGGVAALEDRCSHRSAELSSGRVVEGTVECPYHGWRFQRSGACHHVPGVKPGHPPRGFSVRSFPTRERDGYVWVYPDADHTPDREPFDTTMDLKGYAVHRRVFEFDTTIEAIVENFADPIHTAYAHRGLFRRIPKAPREVKVHIRRTDRQVTWEFENRPPFGGMVAKMLGARGSEMKQRMYFFVPGINRGDVRIGRSLHGITTALHTPVTPERIRMFGEFRYRGPVPTPVGNLLIRPLVLRILRQDNDMLSSQSFNVRRVGREDYRSTEADTFGLLARQLLRRWSEGNPPSPDSEYERTFSLWL